MDLSTILITVLMTGFIKLIIYHYRRLDLYRGGSKIPGLEPVLPIIGNAHLLFGETKNVFRKIILLLEKFKVSPVRAWLGHKLCIILFDPEQMKIVLNSPKTIERDELLRFFLPWLGTGLIAAPAQKWKVHRKLIMPTFNPRVLEKFTVTINKQCEILVNIMEPEIDKEEFDIFNYISLCTIDIVCETIMGVPSNEQIKKNSAYPAAFEKIMKILYQRMIEVWLHPNVIFNATKLAKDQRECIKYLHKQTNDIIEKKLEQYSEKMNGNSITQIEFQRKAFLDFFTELLLEGTKLTTEEFREEVENIMFAGYDTTTTVNSFVILMLANFPKIQEKCYEELVEIFGDKINGGRQIENEDLDRMKYLGRVIKETMRLFPIAPLLIRQVNGDLDIGGGYTLPKGSTVFLAIWKLHRSADIWDDPLCFNPDRFLPEQVAKRHPYAYIPFSAGPRNCIGLKYAMMSMKILLATILRNYIFMKDKHVNIEDIEIKAEVFLKTIDPITIKIKRRKNTFES
ncbi:hypothetical protein G9C98_007194 [Cotesia typhae]|uniref:Cytochrome P450 n=1 Tax=Cotesia typhae TaxID=2053667 RepID=A0A8J5RAY6_9HYME|nr:hypothetical protein G9C98_007194 [Cotesia typhae]